MSLALLLIPVSSLLWRVRGGMINDLTGKANWMGMNDTVVRLLYALGVAATFGVAYGFSPWIAALAIGLFLACTIGWFGADIGLLHPTAEEVALISTSGALRGEIITIAALPFGPSLGPLFAGPLAGPICWISARLPKGPKWLVWEEFIFGAVLGASLIKFNVGGLPF